MICVCRLDGFPEDFQPAQAAPFFHGIRRRRRRRHRHAQITHSERRSLRPSPFQARCRGFPDRRSDILFDVGELFSHAADVPSLFVPNGSIKFCIPTLPRVLSISSCTINGGSSSLLT